MNTKKAAVLLTIGVLFLNGILLYKVVVLKRQTSLYQEVLDDRSENIQKLELLEANFVANLRSSQLVLDNRIVTDSNNKELTMKGLFENDTSKLFVCRFTEFSCDDCIYYAVQKAVSFADSIGCSNMVFLTSYRNNKGLDFAMQNYGIPNQRLYNLDSLSIPIDSKSYPYYFIMDKNLRVYDVFVPDKGVPDITKSYLSVLRNKWI